MSSAKEIMIGDKPLSSLRVVDLKEELEKRGLSKSGSKKDLADRLRNFIQLQKQQEQPTIAADEEQLPNISMQEKLAEQNPFIRDYFASQAELFHSQKVAKKLIEEEARRESEASAPSADEGGDNSAPEDRGLNSSSEAESGKVKKLARRFENQNKNVRENNSESSVVSGEFAENIVKEVPLKSSIERQVERKSLEKEIKNNSENRESVKVSVEKQPSSQEVISNVPKRIEIQENISLDQPTQIEMAVDNLDPKASEEEPKSSASSSPSSSHSRSSSPEPANEEKKPPEEVEEQKSSESSSSEDEDDDSKKSLIEQTKDSNGNVKKLTEKFENQTRNLVDNSEVVEESSEPEPMKEKTSDSEHEKEADDQEGIILKSSPSRLRSPSPVQVRQQPERRGKRRTSSEGVTKSPIKETENKVRKLTEKFERKNSEDSNEADKLKEKDSKINEEIAKEEKNKADLLRRRERFMKQSEPNNSVPVVGAIVQVRKLSSRSEDIADEEVLDYGDEEKIKTEPAKFNWTRRILRLKNTHLPKKHTSKWRRSVDFKLSENINSESLTDWFSEVKLVSASELKLEEKEKSPQTSPTENVEITRKFSIDSEEDPLIKMENITITRKVSLIPMVPSDSNEQEDLSPSRNPTSELLLITNLVRPFTLPQLRELLQRTGTLQELWVDKIKSKCIAKYEQQEEAFETRAALHGVNWPLSNRKALHVDYTSQEVLDEYKARDAGEYKPPVVEQPVTAEVLPVREWDVGKRAKSRSPNRQRRRSRSTSRDRKRSRISPSQNRRRHSRSPNSNHDRRSRVGDGKEPEPLGKALDELFRKTTATPSIYWLPLTPGQIAEKEAERRRRMLERERRLAEMNKNR